MENKYDEFCYQYCSNTEEHIDDVQFDSNSRQPLIDKNEQGGCENDPICS